MLEQLTDGIYMISSIKDGKHLRKMADKIEELPSVMNRAMFEPYTYTISKELSRILKENEESFILGLSKFISVKKIMDTVILCLKK